MKAEVKLSSIFTMFDVRGNSGRLDHDKLLEFAIRVDCGEDLGLPVLTHVETLPKDFVPDPGKTLPSDGFVVVDGRHRIEVYRQELMKPAYRKQEITCDIKIYKTFADILADAGVKNDRPGTPLTRKEWKQNISRMVGTGLARPDVLRLLVAHGMTKPRSEALWAYYREREGSNTLKRALNDVNLRGETIEHAARKHRVGRARLRKAWESQRVYNIGKFITTISTCTGNWEKAMESEYRRVMELDLTAGDREVGRAAVEKIMNRMYTRIGNMVF